MKSHEAIKWYYLEFISVKEVTGKTNFLLLEDLLKKILSILYFFPLRTQLVMYRNIHHEYLQMYTNILTVKWY